MGSSDVDGGADCRVLPYVLCRKMKIKIVGVGKHHDDLFELLWWPVATYMHLSLCSLLLSRKLMSLVGSRGRIS